MRVKKVNRYYCDHCNKSGCAAGHMKKHEKHCTMNPDRECRMCKLLDVEQVPMAEMLSVLPDPEKFIDGILGDKHSEEQAVRAYEKLNEAVEQATEKLRVTTNNCPTCILAALRQKNLTKWGYFFDYRAEAESAMKRADDSD